MSILFTDDFNRSNSTGLGANYTEALNGFNVSSNVAVARVNGLNCVQVSAMSTQTDMYATATVGSVSGAYVGVCVRLDALGNGYLLTIDNSAGGFRISKLIAGANTDIASAAKTVVAGDTISLTAVGTTLGVYFNGVLYNNYTDSTYASGKGGVWGYQLAGTLDNLEIGNFTADLALTVENATLTAAGQALVLDTGGVIGNAAASLAGSDVTLLLGQGIAVTEATLLLSGQDVQLLANQNFTLAVTNAALSFAGDEVPFELATPWTEAGLALTGSDVSLVASLPVTLVVTEAALGLTGGTINLLLDEDFSLTVLSASLSLAGQDVPFQVGGNLVLAVDNGVLTLTGQDVGINPQFSLPSTQGQPRAKRMLARFGR